MALQLARLIAPKSGNALLRRSLSVSTAYQGKQMTVRDALNMALDEDGRSLEWGRRSLRESWRAKPSTTSTRRWCALQEQTFPCPMPSLWRRHPCPRSTMWSRLSRNCSTLAWERRMRLSPTVFAREGSTGRCSDIQNFYLDGKSQVKLIHIVLLQSLRANWLIWLRLTYNHAETINRNQCASICE